MKKLLLILTLFISVSVSAQDKVIKHRPFVAGGTTFSNVSMPISVEVGSWGIASPTSYSLSVDYVPRKGQFEMWAGPKLYYTTYSNDEYKVCYMVYVAPKINVSNADMLYEFGFNPNYQINNDLLFGMTIGNYFTNTSSLNLFMGAGFVYLFK